MKNFFKITNAKTNEDVVVFNLDKLTGKLFLIMSIIGTVTTIKTIKKSITKKGEIKYVKF